MTNILLQTSVSCFSVGAAAAAAAKDINQVLSPGGLHASHLAQQARDAEDIF